MGKLVRAQGETYKEMLPLFRELVLESGLRKGDRVLWSGCPGTCYAMATFYSFGIRDLGFGIFFSVDSSLDEIWRLEYRDHVGVMATRKESPGKAELIILMSGLLRVPFEKTKKLVQEALADSGRVMGETVVPGLFERAGWTKEISFDSFFEFSMVNPAAFVAKR